MPSYILNILHVIIDETHLDKMTGPLGISTIKKNRASQNCVEDTFWPFSKELSYHLLL